MDELLNNPMPTDFKDPSSANCMTRSGASNNAHYKGPLTLELLKFIQDKLTSPGVDPADPTKQLPAPLGWELDKMAEKGKEAVPLHIIAKIAHEWKAKVSQLQTRPRAQAW